MQPAHIYEVRPRKNKRGVDLISDVLPFGRLLYAEPNAASNAIGYAQFYSCCDSRLRCGRQCDRNARARGGNVVPFRSDQVVSSFTHVVLCPAGPPKEHMGKVSPCLIVKSTFYPRAQRNAFRRRDGRRLITFLGTWA